MIMITRLTDVEQIQHCNLHIAGDMAIQYGCILHVMSYIPVKQVNGGMNNILRILW